jgi:hypothetical protein
MISLRFSFEKISGMQDPVDFIFANLRSYYELVNQIFSILRILNQKAFLVRAMARAELIRACLDQDKQQVTHRNDRNSL